MYKDIVQKREKMEGMSSAAAAGIPEDESFIHTLIV